MENAIEVSRLTKQYRIRSTDKRGFFGRRVTCGEAVRTALRDVSFNVKPGECLGVIGLNGSGKSTLLKILAGVVHGTEGSVRLSGRCAALLELGAAFHPEFTGIENIELFMLLQGFSERETKRLLPEILSFAELGEKIKEPVKSYSSGQYVRLAFAAATAVRPDILLVDEALSVGDVFFQQKCWRRMREFAGSCTILFVSHDMNAVTKFCSRTLVLDCGQLVFDGPSRDAVSAFYRIAQVPEMKKHKTGRKRIGADPKAEAAICAADKRTEAAEYGADPFAGRDVRSFYHAADVSVCSGAGDAVIEEYIWKVDEELLAEVCTSDQRIEIGMTISLRRRMESVIIGYQVRDRFGTEVFGETSLTSGFGSSALEAGRIKVFFSFRWPEIREGDYFITLGIGEGSEVLCQTEQCWVNQAIHMKSFPEGNKLIYGILNREMEHFSVVKGNIHL